MFELVKAAASFGWAATVLTADQIGKLMKQPNSETVQRSATALMSVVDVTVSTLGEVSGSVYRAGVRIQNSIPLKTK